MLKWSFTSLFITLALFQVCCQMLFVDTSAGSPLPLGHGSHRSQTGSDPSGWPPPSLHTQSLRINSPITRQDRPIFGNLTGALFVTPAAVQGRFDGRNSPP